MDGCLVGCGGSFQPAWESSGRAICELIIHCAGINRYMLGERFGKTSPLVVSRYSRYSFLGSTYGVLIADADIDERL